MTGDRSRSARGALEGSGSAGAGLVFGASVLCAVVSLVAGAVVPASTPDGARRHAARSAKKASPRPVRIPRGGERFRPRAASSRSDAPAGTLDRPDAPLARSPLVARGRVGDVVVVVARGHRNPVAPRRGNGRGARGRAARSGVARPFLPERRSAAARSSDRDRVRRPDRPRRVRALVRARSAGRARDHVRRRSDRGRSPARPAVRRDRAGDDRRCVRRRAPDLALCRELPDGDPAADPGRAGGRRERRPHLRRRDAHAIGRGALSRRPREARDPRDPLSDRALGRGAPRPRRTSAARRTPRLQPHP